MTHLIAFGFHVFFVVRIAIDADRELFDDAEAVAFESDDFFRIVGEQTNFFQAEVGEDLGAHAVVAQVCGEAEFFVGLDGVEPCFLELVGVDFCGQTDAAAFLAEVKEHPAFLADAFHGGSELLAAIAAFGEKYITREAFRMHADEGGFFWVDFTHDHREMVGALGINLIEVATEITVFRGHVHDFISAHEFLGAAAVLDELGDGAGFESVFFLIRAEFSNTGHGAVIVHDFADDTCGGKSGESGEIDGSLSVTGAAQGAAWHGLERENVAGLHEGIGTDGGVSEQLDRAGSIGRGDAGADARCGIDSDGEGGALDLAIATCHRRQIQCIGTLAADGGADQAATVNGHEGDVLGGAKGGGADEVGLVFAIWVIGHDHESACGNLGNDFVNGAKLQ